MSAGGAFGAFMGGVQQGRSIFADDKPKRLETGKSIGDFEGSDAALEMERQRQELEEEAERLRQQRLEQQNASSGGGMDPSSMMSIGQSFMGSGGGAAGASGGAAGASSGAASASSGAAGASGGAAGASSAGSAMASAGPWAALAAAIVINENSAKKGGYRREGSDYYKDLASGRVLSQDVDQRWAPKIFGKNDKAGLGSDMSAAASIGSFQFGKGFKELKNGSLGKFIKKIF